jgi:hypothetical protein
MPVGSIRWMAAIAGASLGLATGATMAQDSVSTAPGLPGDAVSAYQAGASSEQINNYTVDLAPKSGSWGTRFVMGPVVKASRSNNGQYFDLLIGAQTASNRFSAGPLLRSSYSLWTTPGQGVNGTSNAAPATTLSTGTLAGQQFAMSFMEFASGVDGVFGSGDDENNVVTALVNFQRRVPTRLYVSRVVAMANKSSAAASGTASFGLGGVDAAGNVHIYGDGQAMVHAQRLSQAYYLRVNSATRLATFANPIVDGLANDGASTRFVRGAQTSMTTPTIIPSSLGAGSRPVMIGLDFNSDYIFESAANTTQTTKAYLPGASGSPRGNLTFIAQTFAPVATGGSDAGTAACLVRTDGNTRTRGIEIFGVNTDGSVDSTLQIQLPTSGTQIIDPTDNWDPQTNFGALTNHEFTSYASQVSFRGGNGQVATVVLPGGELLAAAVVQPGSGSAVPQPQDDYLAVATISAGGAATWRIAAHTGDVAGAAGGVSKVILGDNGADGLPGTGDAGEGDGVVDTAPGAWIGRLAKLSEVFPTQTSGPSISAPALDRRGNVYFMAAVAMRNNDGSLEYTSALLRGVRDTSTGGYQLELLARLGDVLRGLNSGRNYQIQFLGFADGDSAASGGLWAGNIVQDSVGGGNAAGAPYGSALSLGALVFRTKIVYDYNDDGVFADPSAGASSSPDQAYNAVMVLMPAVKGGDFNLDGVTSVQDIFDFLAAYFGGAGAGGDWNGDGTVSVQDIFDFLADYFGG